MYLWKILLPACLLQSHPKRGVLPPTLQSCACKSFYLCVVIFDCIFSRFTSHRGSVTWATFRHANVLSACAIITAMPYTSPSIPWFSDVLYKLCRLSDEGGPVGQSVRGMIGPRCSCWMKSFFWIQTLCIHRFVQQSASTERYTTTHGTTYVCILQRSFGNLSTAVLQAILILRRCCAKWIIFFVQNMAL